MVQTDLQHQSTKNGHWEKIKKEFFLDDTYIHLSLSLIAPHHKKLREAIEKHRMGFDTNPGKYFKNKDKIQYSVLESAAKYLNTVPDSIALTESTTMGLATVYHGMHVYPGDEILTTDHEHYASSEILRFKARDTGVTIKKIRLYDDPRLADKDQITANIINSITPSTRVLALTWVHSSTGVKIPIASIGEELKKLNRLRIDKEKILLCIDGLHGLGIENFNVEELNADFFIAGCHKSLFGPRGTGIVWGSTLGWSRVQPLITSFDVEVFWPWYEGHDPDHISPKARLCSPGGFGTFEHRWALKEAFDFHIAIGKERIRERVHELNSYAKEKMSSLKGITIFTPNAETLSSGMVCFLVNGKDPNEIVDLFETKRIIIGQTPYRDSYNRFSIGILNTFEDIDKAIAVLKAL